MRVVAVLLAAALVATMAAAGSRLHERSRAGRLDGEAAGASVIGTGEGTRLGRPAVGALKGLDADIAAAVRRAGRSLDRALAGFSRRRGSGAGGL